MTITCKNYELTPDMIDEIKKQTIYWSDDRLCHWFFDFKFQDKWISSKHINNELTEIEVEIYDPISLPVQVKSFDSKYMR